MQFAKAKGIDVIAVDSREEGRELWKQAGAEHIFDARAGKDKVVQGVQQLTNGFGVKAAIHVSEHEISAPLACAITPMHGVVVEIAQPDIDAMPFHELIFRDIQLTGSRVAGRGSRGRNSRRRCSTKLESITSRSKPISSMIWRRYRR